jgi:sialic acid synthase SpsE
MTPCVSLSGRAVGRRHPRYAIFETSANHNYELGTVFHIIDDEKTARGDTVMGPTDSQETVTVTSDLLEFQHHHGFCAGRTLCQAFKWGRTRSKWHKALFAQAKTGITAFSSPFDLSACEATCGSWLVIFVA